MAKDAITIRPATAADAEAITAMWLQMSAQHASYDAERWDFVADRADQWRAAFVESLAKDETMVLLAVDATGRAVGFVSAKMTEAPPQLAVRRSATINDIFIAPARRRQGVGTKLMQAALAESRRRGAGAVGLLVAAANQQAMEFYKRQGLRLTAHQMFMRL